MPINCPRCGKVFSKVSSPICKACEAEEERLFQRVREFLQENKNATVAQVVEATGVSVKRIHKYLKDGKIEATDGMAGILKCSSCGINILSGRMCTACSGEVGQTMSDIVKSNEASKAAAEKKKSGGMHTRN